MAVAEYHRVQSSARELRLPFGPDLLFQLGKDLLSCKSAKAVIVWGYALLGFFSLARPGEVWGPINIDPESDHVLHWNNADFSTEWVNLRFVSSKEDRYRKGAAKVHATDVNVYGTGARSELEVHATGNVRVYETGSGSKVEVHAEQDVTVTGNDIKSQVDVYATRNTFFEVDGQRTKVDKKKDQYVIFGPDSIMGRVAPINP